jgi:hypothetical protein
MKIAWNETQNHFRIEITFQDIEVVKAAGFKTTGPPNWEWYTTKIAPLAYLKKNKIQVTITELALQKYKILSEQEEQKQAIRKQYKQARKQADKDRGVGTIELVIPEKGYIDISDLPPKPLLYTPFVRPPAPEVYCLVCGDPLYQYDYEDICIWCAK